MLRILLFGALGAMTGGVFGLAFGGAIGAAFGAIGCLMGGVGIAMYMNRNQVFSGPFFSESYIEPLLYMVDRRILYFLPSCLSNPITSYLRSVMERWL